MYAAALEQRILRQIIYLNIVHHFIDVLKGFDQWEPVLISFNSWTQCHGKLKSNSEILIIYNIKS